MGRRDVQISELIIPMATTGPVDEPRMLTEADQLEKMKSARDP